MPLLLHPGQALWASAGLRLALRHGALTGAWLHPLRLPHGKHQQLTAPILVGVFAGVLTRGFLLRADSHPFPSHGHGRLNYLFLGLVAAVLGALSPAAILTADYTAGVFLGLGLTQFHTVRQIERSMLLSLEDAELVPRGKAYVEGIAMALETRNYLAMLAAMTATTLGLLWGLLPGLAAGLVASLSTERLAGLGRRVGTVADVRLAEVSLSGDSICVDGTAVWLQAPPEARQAAPKALGLVVHPRDLAARLTLAQPGQRQALLHDLAAGLGVQSRPCCGDASQTRPPAASAGHPEPAGHGQHALLPREALAAADGSVRILLFPEVRHPQLALQVARRVPLLETLAHGRLRGQPPEQGQDNEQAEAPEDEGL